MLALIEGSPHGYLRLVDAAVMLTSRDYLPADSSHEVVMSDALVAAHRAFTKPLRYGGETVLPDFVLTDTDPPTVVEVWGIAGRSDYEARKRTKLDALRRREHCSRDQLDRHRSASTHPAINARPLLRPASGSLVPGPSASTAASISRGQGQERRSTSLELPRGPGDFRAPDEGSSRPARAPSRSPRRRAASGLFRTSPTPTSGECAATREKPR